MDIRGTWDETIERRIEKLRELAGLFAEAKGERVQIEHFRSSKKAMLMKGAAVEGVKSAAAQERDAYASKDYRELLVAIGRAVEREERLRWDLRLAEMRFEAWRSHEATKRAELQLR